MLSLIKLHRAVDMGEIRSYIYKSSSLITFKPFFLSKAAVIP